MATTLCVRYVARAESCVMMYLGVAKAVAYDRRVQFGLCQAV
jgi:hypothetical protein